VRRRGEQVWGKLRSRALRWWDARGGAYRRELKSAVDPWQARTRRKFGKELPILQDCIATPSKLPYRAANERTPVDMSQAKRPANDAFGSNQLVKRAKSDANLDSTAVAISSGTGQNGALIRAVCAILRL
jgi:hypothetical protein